MGSYGVIKEALLVKENSNGKATIVQKLLPSTVNGALISVDGSGFLVNGIKAGVSCVNRGGVFGAIVGANAKDLLSVNVNIPGDGVKYFGGYPEIESSGGLGEYVRLTLDDKEDSSHYTHLYLGVKVPGDAFVVEGV